MTKNKLKQLTTNIVMGIFYGFMGALAYSYESIHREMKIYGMTTSAIEADIRACEEINNTKCKVSFTIIDTKVKK